MTYPSREEIRSLCTEQSFERGVSYYEQDRILELTVDGGEVTATVRGSSDYRVSIDVGGDTIHTSCSCPYDYAGDCKHIVAVLLAVEDRESDAAANTSDSALSRTTTDLEALVEQTAASDLREFLLETLREDRDVRDRFIAFTGVDTDRTAYDYKQEIGRLFDNAAGRGGFVEYGTRVDLSQYHDLAATHRDRGHVAEATDIYRALAETIRENFERVDDSSGHYGQELARAIEEYAETIIEQDPAHERKRPHIEYLFEEFIEADYGFASDYYDNALQMLCTTDADHEYWLELLDVYVSGVDLEPAAIDREVTSDPETRQTSPEMDNGGQSTDDEYQSEDTLATDREWADDVLYASDFTDGPLTTDDFTGGTLDVQHLAVGPLEIEYFVGNAFDELRIDDQTIVEDHTADIDETGTTESETGVVSSLRRQRVLSTYIYLLEELDEDDALTALYEDIYLENSTFCEEYVQRLIDRGDEQHAIEVVENGLETFGSSSTLRWHAVDLYRNRKPDRYRDALERLFLDHSEWSAYDDLKEACSDSEWADIYQEFEWHFDENDRRRLIAMYVHEGELEKAFFELQTAENLSWVRRYRDPVATVDPVEYFELYRELLVPFAANDTGRRHYREIADHLAEMQELVSAERFEEFVDSLKEKHSNRPAFLDELEKAGF